MANGNYLPRADKDKVVWLKNFANKFANYGTGLGFTAAEITAVANDSAMFTYIVDYVEIFKTESNKRVAYKNLLASGEIGSSLGAVPGLPTVAVPPTAVPAGIFKRLAKTVARIKNHPTYNASIGQDLGIIGSVNSIDEEEMKPILKGAHDAGRPLIKWKKGHADSLDIYVDRKDGNGFVFLANDSQPDYVDTFALPANQNSGVWDYKAIYRIADEQVGAFSDTVSITVTKNISVM